jgi:hypothetical protein
LFCIKNKISSIPKDKKEKYIMKRLVFIWIFIVCIGVIGFTPFSIFLEDNNVVDDTKCVIPNIDFTLSPSINSIAPVVVKPVYNFFESSQSCFNDPAFNYRFDNQLYYNLDTTHNPSSQSVTKFKLYSAARTEIIYFNLTSAFKKLGIFRMSKMWSDFGIGAGALEYTFGCEWKRKIDLEVYSYPLSYMKEEDVYITGWQSLVPFSVYFFLDKSEDNLFYLELSSALATYITNDTDEAEAVSYYADASEANRSFAPWDFGIRWQFKDVLLSAGFIMMSLSQDDHVGMSFLPFSKKTFYVGVGIGLGGNSSSEHVGWPNSEDVVGLASWHTRGSAETYTPNIVGQIRLDDKGGSGNSNGILDAEEECLLDIYLNNDGNGHAKNIEINLVFPDEIRKYILLGQIETIPSLAPRESKTIKVKIKGSKDLPKDNFVISAVTNLKEAKIIPLRLNTNSILEVTGKPQLPPYPIAQLSILPQTGVVQAGESIQLNLKIENKGKGALYGLCGRIKSDHPKMDDKPLPFGKIEQKETKSVNFKLDIPHTEKSQKVSFEITFFEQNDYIPDPIKGTFYIEEKPKPQFVYSCQPIDDNSGNSVGNGDGRIQKGEAVDLLLTIKNVGGNPTEELTAQISSPKITGLELNIPQIKIGKLEPNKHTSIRLTFSPKKTYRPAKIALGLIFEDKYWEIKNDSEVVFPLEESIGPQIMELKMVATPLEKETVIRGGAGQNTSIIAKIEKGGTLLVTGQLGDWYRVELPDGLKGWLPSNVVTIAKKRITDEEAKETLTTAQPAVIRVYEQTPPSIALFSPNVTSLQTPAGKLTIQGLITDDKEIKEVNIKVNGETIFTRGIAIVPADRKQKEMKIEEDIPLREGENIITIIATDNDGLTARKDISVERLKEIPEIWAVVIGISDYDKMRDLKYAAEDARAFAQYLTEDVGVPADHIKILLNNQATALKIKDALGDFLKKTAKKEDEVIIYFAGHGAVEDDSSSPDGDGLSKYLLAWDTDPKSLYSTGLPMDEIARIFGRINAERVIYIGDTCYSGASGGRTILARATRATLSDKFMERLSAGKGRIIITASGSNEVSLEDEKLQHGIFTYYLLEGLKGKADFDKDGFISVEEIYNYVSKEVPKATGQSQKPILKGDLGGNMVIGKVK